MAIQVITRLSWLLVSLIIASMLVFTVVNVLPGDVAAVILGTSATPQALETLQHQLGLDQPAWLRYLQWIGGMLHRDFGTSLLSHSEVGPLISQKLSVSGPLALGAALSFCLESCFFFSTKTGVFGLKPRVFLSSTLSFLGCQTLSLRLSKKSCFVLDSECRGNFSRGGFRAPDRIAAYNTARQIFG